STNDNELDYDVEIKPFLFNEISFEKARACAEADENSDLIFLNNISDNNIEINDELSSDFSSEPSTSNLYENEFLIENLVSKKNTCQMLTRCSILDIDEECFIIHGGYFFEKQDHGREPFNCTNMHNNDISKALQLLGHWILHIAGTTDEDKKKDSFSMSSF
ncbi:35876_t:CDS:2, partial [Racocetra persica]